MEGSCTTPVVPLCVGMSLATKRCVEHLHIVPLCGDEPGMGRAWPFSVGLPKRPERLFPCVGMSLLQTLL